MVHPPSPPNADFFKAGHILKGHPLSTSLPQLNLLKCGSIPQQAYFDGGSILLTAFIIPSFSKILLPVSISNNSRALAKGGKSIWPGSFHSPAWYKLC